MERLSSLAFPKNSKNANFKNHQLCVMTTNSLARFC